MNVREIAQDLRHWERWEGVTGTWYARRRGMDPPLLLRAETPEKLARVVRDYLSMCHPGTAKPFNGLPLVGEDPVEAVNPQPPLPLALAPEDGE